MRDVVRLFLTVVVLFGALGTLGFVATYPISHVNLATTDDASAQGTVAEISADKGIVWETTSIELLTGDDADSTERYCIPSTGDEQLEALRRAIQSGDRVTIEYSEPRHAPPWECPGSMGGPMVVTDVTVHGGASA